MILQTIQENSEVELENLKKIFWSKLTEDEVYNVNIGERITSLYLAELIRKSPSYGGYILTRKGKKTLAAVEAS